MAPTRRASTNRSHHVADGRRSGDIVGDSVAAGGSGDVAGAFSGGCYLGHHSVSLSFPSKARLSTSVTRPQSTASCLTMTGVNPRRSP